jgi:Recombination endonuclease VII.
VDEFQSGSLYDLLPTIDTSKVFSGSTEYFANRLYGLDLEAYKALVEEADGACMLCGEADKQLIIDHSHTTARVRGLICYSCNAIMRQYDKLAIKLPAIFVYLERRA